MPALFPPALTAAETPDAAEADHSWRGLLRTGLLYFAASLDPGLMPELLERDDFATAPTADLPTDSEERERVLTARVSRLLFPPF